ncbi:MAG TPA: LPS assembly protein LptD, partial [Hyphomonadaceae bacterium]|nr:LPS assembly protein LptD [Hyphomonadaceae bacterium]
MVLRLTCLASAMAVLSAAATATAQTPTTTAAPTSAATTDDVLLQAKVITEDHKNQIITAEGDVEVRVGVRTLRADRLVYDQGKHTLRAQGHVQITDDKGQAQFSDDFQADEDFTNGFATRFSARLTSNTLLTASSAIRTDGIRNSLEQVVYTGCPICEETGQTPTWSIRARRAVQNSETQMITYEDAVFEVKGIPILYMPWFAHPDPTSERRSGFIPASKPIGVSSKLGGYVETPYYWAISPSQDMTISPMFSTEVNPLIKVDYRKRFFSGYVDFQGSFTHEQDFNSDGAKFGDDTWRSHLFGTGVFDINKDWKWGFGVEHQSDDLYDRRYGIDGEDDLRGLIASQPRQLVTQIYTTGQDKDFYFEASSYFFQGLRAGDDDAKFPKVAPSIFTEKAFDLGAYGRVETDFSAVGLFRDAVETLPSGEPTLDSARATGSANWTAQYIVGPGLVVAPFAFGRGDAYRLDDGSATGARNVDRLLGVAGAQVSYPFIRRGENTDIIIEPIVMVGYGT